jgi:hypothetical protein
MSAHPLLALLVALGTIALPLAPVAGAARDPVPHARGWPSLALAMLRPGSLVTSLAGECTTNFVFAGPGNASLYLGTAATCVRGLALGDAVVLERGATGRLAYSSHLTLETMGVTDAAAYAENDFALILVDDAHRALVQTSSALFATPGIMGDMGSPVLTRGGAAVGLLTTLDATGTNGVTHLDDALSFAAAHAGVKATLVTWPLLKAS